MISNERIDVTRHRRPLWFRDSRQSPSGDVLLEGKIVDTEQRHTETVQGHLREIHSSFLRIYVYGDGREPTYTERKALYRRGREAIVALWNDPQLSGTQKAEFDGLVSQIAPERLPIPFRQDDPNVADLNSYLKRHPNEIDPIEGEGPIETMDARVFYSWLYDVTAHSQEQELLPLGLTESVVRGYFVDGAYSSFLSHAARARVGQLAGENRTPQDAFMLMQIVPSLARETTPEATTLTLDVFNTAATVYGKDQSFVEDMEGLIVSSLQALRSLITEKENLSELSEQQRDSLRRYWQQIQIGQRYNLAIREELGGLIEEMDTKEATVGAETGDPAQTASVRLAAVRDASSRRRTAVRDPEEARAWMNELMGGFERGRRAGDEGVVGSGTTVVTSARTDESLPVNLNAARRVDPATYKAVLDGLRAL